MIKVIDTKNKTLDVYGLNDLMQRFNIQACISNEMIMVYDEGCLSHIFIKCEHGFNIKDKEKDYTINAYYQERLLDRVISYCIDRCSDYYELLFIRDYKLIPYNRM